MYITSRDRFQTLHHLSIDHTIGVEPAMRVEDFDLILWARNARGFGARCLLLCVQNINGCKQTSSSIPPFVHTTLLYYINRSAKLIGLTMFPHLVCSYGVLIGWPLATFWWQFEPTASRPIRKTITYVGTYVG